MPGGLDAVLRALRDQPETPTQLRAAPDVMRAVVDEARAIQYVGGQLSFMGVPIVLDANLGAGQAVAVSPRQVAQPVQFPREYLTERIQPEYVPPREISATAMRIQQQAYMRVVEERIQAAERAMGAALSRGLYGPPARTMDDLEREKRCGTVPRPTKTGRPRQRDVWFLPRALVAEARATAEAMRARGWSPSFNMDGWIKPRRPDDVDVL